MTSYNAANERMKRRYFAYLAEAQGYSEQTIDAVAKAIARFEEYTKWRDFKKFHIEQAKGFKHSLAGQRGCRSGEPLSKATLYATVTALKRFFVWLAGQPGYKSRISYTDAEYFSLSAKDTRIAKANRPARVPTDEIYRAREKPLRFLRYYLLASFDVDTKLREEVIYDWFLKNEKLTGHNSEPLKFAQRLLNAAKAYSHFASNQNASGGAERGIVNTRLLGGESIKQHFIILMAGRHLSPANFSRLCDEIERTMFVWLITRTPGKEYERRIVDAAHALRSTTNETFDQFVLTHFSKERSGLASEFSTRLLTLNSGDARQFRIRYLLAKITQHVDLQAYGPSQGRDDLQDYVSGGNDIEHILPDNGDDDAIAEFGVGGNDQRLIQRLGNLLLIEKSINRAIHNGRYSTKIAVYPQSKFLLTRCQASKQSGQVGVADKITTTVESLDVFPEWNMEAIERRQAFLTKLAAKVWDVQPSGSTVSA